MTEGAKIKAARARWEAATRAWSRDDCKDVIVTMQRGEAMMYAATDMIIALEDALDEASGR